MRATPTAGAAPLFASDLQRRAVSICLLVLIACELGHLYLGAAVFQIVGRAATLAFYAVALSRLGLRERALSLVCLILAGALVLNGKAPLLGRALDQTMFLVAFIQTMSLLREAAVRSAAVRDVGAFLTRQPPRRRTWANLLGGHAMGILLNFGALSLLGPLIQNGVRATSQDQEVAQIRERRQLSALLRGFSWIVVWAPTTVTQALIAENLPASHPPTLMALGLVTVVMIFTLAWMEDQAMWRKTAARLRASGRIRDEPAPTPHRALRNLAGICFMLLGCALVIRWACGVSTVAALMLTGPICLVAWTAIQVAPGGLRATLNETKQVLREVANGPVPNSARECATLGASGFIGVAAAALVPVGTVAHWLDVMQLSPALLLALLPLLVVLAAQFALSPIMMVVFLASIVSALPEAPADPTLIAFALSCGWAITMTAGPNAAGALIMSRVTGHSPYVLTWHWNLAFSALAYAVLALGFVVLGGVW